MLRIILSILVFAAIAGVFVWLGRDLRPPPGLVFAAGAEGGGYHAIARRYRDILARDGVEVEILATSGSLDNAFLLADGGADVALLQGGVALPDGTAAEALGAMFLEPLFIFARAELDLPANPGVWRDLRIAAGPPGSGAREAAEVFLSAARIPEGEVELTDEGGDAAARAVIEGRADVALFVAPLGAPYLRGLFVATEAELVAIGPLRAVARRMPDAQEVMLPAGALSLEPPMPRADVRMIALTATLVARADLHPALVDRLVEAARIIHGRRDAITEQGRFPNPTEVSLPMDAYAQGLLEDGPSPARDWLPWWAAAQIDRVLVLALPLLILAVPVLRLVPALYAWRMRSRVWQFYDRLRGIDAEITAGPSLVRATELARLLDELDERLATMSLPSSYADNAYAARMHLDHVRQRLAERMQTD